MFLHCSVAAKPTSAVDLEGYYDADGYYLYYDAGTRATDHIIYFMSIYLVYRSNLKSLICNHFFFVDIIRIASTAGSKSK